MSIYSQLSNDNKSSSTPYPYSSYISSPAALGSSQKGDMDTVETDFKILNKYLITLMGPAGSFGKDKSSANTTGQPLGNKYFYNTGATCTDTDGNTQQRYIYINNIPDGNIPLIASQGSGYTGLVPGIMENMEYMDPTILLKAFEDTDQTCQEITMETVDNYNVKSQESHYVLNSDISTYNSCWFNLQNPSTNPVTGETCNNPVESMSTRKKYSVISNDIWLQTYMYGVTAMGCYLLYSLLYKKK